MSGKSEKRNVQRGILCPKCGSGNSLVYDSRKRRDFSQIRRRECQQCKFRFTTVECLYGYEFVNSGNGAGKKGDHG